ncbi:MAG: S-layer homology domain-containing protein [Clostridia bacterium]|nr:S-layer homology domain-containing protein [Clostridia bacterium]
MKLSKRLLATLLATVFVLVNLVTVPVFADFTDLKAEHSVFEAVNVLNKLGVINGYDDGSFKPDNNVTRAEFTAMLLRTRGMGAVGSTSLENPPFPDVVTPDVSWAIGNIRTARELGIVNGYDDGTFKPNNNVSYEEAVKMIVCALGYGEMGSEGAFWYSKYIMTATSLGFLDGAGGAIATPATRATIAQMLYNCLEVNLAEDNEITDKTILENDLKLTKNVGYISSNPEISLSKPDANLRSDEVEITSANGVFTYKVEDNSKYNDMLGAQIEFYYQNDLNSGFKNLVLATVKDSTTIKIDASLIQRASGSGISYLKSADAERETTASVASNSVVVYNGKLYGTANDSTSTFATYYAAEGVPMLGRIELLDRDGDNSYDVVFVYDYEPYFVSEVTSYNFKITDNALRKGLPDTDRQKVLDYKNENIRFYTNDGNETSFSAIKKGNVVFVAKSKHSNSVTSVIICDDTVSGKVTGTSSSKGFTINGKDYKASAIAPWENIISGATPSLTVPPVMGDTAKFYLDMEGNIIWYDKTEAANSQQYGYIIDVDLDTDSFEGETLKVLISTASTPRGTIYTVTDKSKLNGSVPASLSTYKSDLDLANDAHTYPNSSSDTYAQAVKFTVSKSSEIEEIITATDTGADTVESIASDSLRFYGDITGTENATYSSNKQFYTSDSQKIGIGSATILSVPENKLETTKYKKLSATDLTAGSGYNIEVFDVTSTRSAKLVLVYKGASNAGQVKANSPVFVITDIEHSDRYKLSGYVGSSPKTYELSIEDSTTISVAPSLKIGDVVRLGTDDEGYYTVKSEHIIFSTDSSYRTGTYPKEEKVGTNVKYKVIWGSVYTRDDDILMLSTNLLTGTETDDQVTDTFQIDRSKTTNAKIYTYDLTGPNLVITEHKKEDNAAVIGSLGVLSGGSPAEVFVHMTDSSTVATMIIVNR